MTSRNDAIVRATRAVCEPIERRLLLASTITGTTQNFDLLPFIENPGDGQGNKITLNTADLLAFQTNTFGRVETSYVIQDFVERFDTDFSVDRSFGMRFEVWRDNDTNDALGAADTKITDVDDDQDVELPAGRYLYVVTPTAGDASTAAKVRVSLRLSATSGPKVLVTGSGQTITDGDNTPTFTDFTDFGPAPLGVANFDRTFVVKNTGGSTLNLGAVNAPAGFVVKSGLPGTLAPGASASFTITMGTSTAGVKSGVVSFSTNDSSVNTFSFNITGNVDPTFLPAKSGFRRLRINGTAGADTITLTQNATRVIFDVNGNLYSVLKTKITRGISVDAMPGDDLVTVASDITLRVLIVGNFGNDTLIGGGGGDSLLGLDGDDVLRGGLGQDLIDGGDGGDTADYSERTNAVSVDPDNQPDDGEPGENDVVLDNVENILGGAGDDTLMGDNGPNFINGLGGKDFILGLGGDDILRGGSGNDTIRPGTGSDQIMGESGSDQAEYAEWSTDLLLSNDDVANDGASGENDNIGSDIERITGGEGDDVIDLFGNGAIAFGFGGSDTIRGTDGNDALFGGNDDDTLIGFGGNDYLEGNAGNDFAAGRRGNDTLVGGSGNDTLSGESDDDTVNGEEGDDVLTGDLGADSLNGGPGNDSLDASGQFAGSGTDGIDRLFGGPGTDTLFGQDFDGPIVDILDGGDDTDSLASFDAGDQILNIP